MNKIFRSLLFLFFILVIPVFSEERRSFISFADTGWYIKESEKAEAPGPNIFSKLAVKKHTRSNSIILSVESLDNSWNCAEIYSRDIFTYGRFDLRFSISGDLDSNAVFGFFLYNHQLPPYFNEIDFELASWGNPDWMNAQFTVQPYTDKNNILTFEAPTVMQEYSVSILWLKDRISFSLRDNNGGEVQGWDYCGRTLPTVAECRVHMNLWLFQGQEPAGDGETSVLLHDFRYTEIY